MARSKGIRHFVDHIRDEQVNKLCELFELGNVPIDDLLADYAINPESLQQQLKDALSKFAQHMQPMLQQQNNQKREQGVDLTLEFLHALGDISPDFQRLLIDHNLQHATTQKVMQDKHLQQQLANLLQHATNVQVTRQLHVDLLARLRKVLQQAHSAQSNYVDGLKQAVDPQRKAAAEDLRSMANNAVESANSNAMFDPPRKIGQLLAILYFTNYVLPFEKIYYPDLQPVVKKSDVKNDPFKDLNRRRFGGMNNDVDVYPTGGAPQAQLPPGIKG